MMNSCFTKSGAFLRHLGQMRFLTLSADAKTFEQPRQIAFSFGGFLNGLSNAGSFFRFDFDGVSVGDVVWFSERA